MESLKTRLCCCCIYKRCFSVVLCIFQKMSGKRRADGYGRRRGNARPRWQAIIIVCLCLCIGYMIWPSGSKDNVLVNTVPNEDFYEQHTKTALRISSNYALSDRIWYKNEYGTNLYHIRPNMVQLSNCTIYVSAVLG